MIKNRIERLRGFLKGLSLAGVVITEMKNIRYFSGFTGSDGVLVVGEEHGVFLTDGRYTTQASGEVHLFPVEEYKKKAEGISSVIDGMGLEKVGVESYNMTLFAFEELKKAVSGSELVLIKEDLSKLRMLKEEGEIDCIRKAIKISEDALDEITPMIVPGVSEADIAVELEYVMKKRGSGPIPFPAIIASGENGAIVHATPGLRKLKKGDLLLIDFGAVFKGYSSDQTITYQISNGGAKAEGEKRKIFDVVRSAQREGIVRARDGVSVKEVDEAVREFINEKGFGKYFTHGTGHGVGLNVHEPPTISSLSDDVLVAGMVITIEPGIYIPGWGGVRLEDMILITEDSPKVLTTIPKSFKVLN